MQYSKQQAVYFAAGKFKDDSAPRFVSAPFALVTISGVPHIQPVSIAMDDQAAAQVDSTDTDMATLAGQLWYEDISPVTLQQHQMGDGSDGWIGMFMLGYI